MEPKLGTYASCDALIKCCYFRPDLTTNMDSSDDFGFYQETYAKIWKPFHQ